MAREVGSDARARKRERDKQNQRQRRRRERDAFEELQRKNELLEQQVKALRGGNTSDVQSLSDTVQRLEQRNKDLKDRLETVDHFIKLWNSKGTEASSRSESAIDNKTSNGVSVPISQVSSPASSTPLVASSLAPTATEYFPGRRATSIPSDWSGSITSPVAERADLSNVEIRVPEQRLQRMLSAPAWARLPVNLSSSAKSFQPWFDPFSGISDRLRTVPEALGTCAAVPSPLDLLYGDSSNELANWVASVTYPNPSRRTEKLAYSWSTYMVQKWKIEPTEENFGRIPTMLHPTPRQLCIPHAPILDFVAWPTMRDNIISSGTKYCRPEVFGLLFVTCRLKNTPNADWIVRSADEEPRLDPSFVETFNNMENWVLLDRFWRDYPELVKGLDPHKFMISEQDLV